MKGFFAKTEIQSIIQTNRKLTCFACKLYKGGINTPKMQPTGNFRKKILNIGDYTTGADDASGKHFQGKDNILKTVYAKYGINLEEDCLNVNSVMCNAYDKETGKTRVPTEKEIDCCRINILKVIEQYKPELIVVFGKTALTSVIGHLWGNDIGGIDKWRGFVIPDQKLKCWIAPVYAPSYVKVLSLNKPEVQKIWEDDLQWALRHLTMMFPIPIEPKITVLKSLEKLRTIPGNAITAFDYETTGLKPHAPGHRIVCVSIAISENEVYVFEMPKTKEKRAPFIEYLKNPGIKKMAHNIKYEETWSWIILKTRVKNWFWDSMQAAHILDNRTGVTGLKFQTYIHFGISGYDDEVKKWLQAVDQKNANSLNKIIDFMKTLHGKNAVLTYCAYDSIYEYRLALMQQKVIDNILPF